MKGVEEIRRLTASLLDEREAEDYIRNISEESLREMQGAKIKDDVEAYASAATTACNKYYGHDMRYDGEYYLFRAGDGCPGDGCGTLWWKLSQRYWNHHFLSRRCGGHNSLAELKFTRR